MGRRTRLIAWESVPARFAVWHDKSHFVGHGPSPRRHRSRPTPVGSSEGDGCNRWATSGNIHCSPVLPSGRVTAGPTFRVLGPLEVTVDGTSLDLGGPRQVALLAMLLIHANRAVSTDVLLTEVWGEAGGSVKRLSVAVARLRKALAPAQVDGAIVVRTVRSGYLLSVEPGTIDADAFEANVAKR